MQSLAKSFLSLYLPDALYTKTTAEYPLGRQKLALSTTQPPISLGILGLRKVRGASDGQFGVPLFS